MSADNGIYILQTPKDNTPIGSPKARSEFRVAHLQAVDNYQTIEEAREAWGDPVYDTENEAFAEALKMSKDYEILEYGISVIYMDQVF